MFEPLFGSDPHHGENLDPDPHQIKKPEPHQIKIRIRIRIRVICRIRIRIKVMWIHNTGFKEGQGNAKNDAIPNSCINEQYRIVRQLNFNI